MESIKKFAAPFNHPLEIGFRSLIILDAFYPKSLDLTYLTWFDHLIVNTSDFEGMDSLHPRIPYRTGEILVRRKLVQNGLDLMRAHGLIDLTSDFTGFSYKVSDDSNFIIDLITSNYGLALKERADWINTQFGKLTHDELKAIITKKLGCWNIEFQNSEINLKGDL